MSHARFGVQALVVLALMLGVSWPEQASVRALPMWRANGPLMRTRAEPGQRPREGARRGEYGFGRASYFGSMPGGSGPDALRRLFENQVERRRKRQTPASVLALGGKVNGILGRAWDALNSPMPAARLQLRSLTDGRLEARAVADGSGEFAFLDVMPDGYIVELVGSQGAVIAVSDPIFIEADDVQLTSVRAAAAARWRALFGNVLASTVDEPVAAASRDGVDAVTAPARCVSPPCNR